MSATRPRKPVAECQACPTSITMEDRSFTTEEPRKATHIVQANWSTREWKALRAKDVAPRYCADCAKARAKEYNQQLYGRFFRSKETSPNAR